MASSRSTALVSAGLGLAVALGVALWLGQSSAPPPEPPPGPPVAPSAARSAAPGPTAGDVPAATAAPAAEAAPPRARTHLPRPPRPTSAIAALDEGAADADEPREDAGPVDRREGDRGDSSQMLADIKAGMDSARDDISDCIESWAEVEPDIDGTVMVGFSLGPDGLEDAWIADYADVPAGPLTCFASAVWEVDWADITEEPLEVTFPFEVRTGEEEAE